MCFASTCFPLAYRFASCRNFWAWISKSPPKPLFFLKRESRSNSTRLRRADARNLSPNSRFSLGGCALCWFQGSLVFWAHFQVFVHLWSLKKVAEGNFGFKTVKICKHGWMLSNLSVVFFAFSCMGWHVFRNSIHFREFSDRRFCLPPMFAHAFWCFLRVD